MPAIKLYGRRWHFGTDIIPLPAALAFTFHFSWVLILLIGAIATGQWPATHCDSWQGIQYAVLFGAYFGSFVLSSIVDAFLFYHGLQGAPFEEKKRRMVVPLLYAGTFPLLVQAAATFYGTWVCVDLEPDCWENLGDTRNAVTNFAQALVFINWLFIFLAAIGIAIFYNMYPQVHRKETWEQRCGCIATLLCCRELIEKPAHEGRRPPLENIAELAAGILSHIDIDATDLAAAVVLTSAAQQRRRRLRIAKALLPVYQTLREGQQELQRQRQGHDGSRYNDGGIEAAERGEDNFHLSTAFDPGSIFEEREREELELEDEESAESSSEEEITTQKGRRRRKGKGRKKRRHVGPGGILRAKYYEDADDPGWLPSDSKLTRALTLVRQASQLQQQPEQEQQEQEQQAVPPLPPTPTVAERSKSLDLTTDNVAALNTVQKLGELEEKGEEERELFYESIEKSRITGRKVDMNLPAGGGGGGVEGMSAAAAELVADEIATTASTQEGASPGQTIDQLASAIQEEVERLGEGTVEESVLTIKEQDSLDLTNIRIDPKNPMIWVRPSRSDSDPGSPISVSAGGKMIKPSVSREVTVHAVGQIDGGSGPGGEGDSGEGNVVEVTVEDANEEKIAAAAADALAAVVEEARPGSETGGGGGDGDQEKKSRPSSSSSHSEEHQNKLPLERQITLRHPTVITPSEHVENFTGPLSPEALTEIYAGRHESVPSSTLKFASSFLRYAYAVYALHSRMEHPNRFLDFLCFAPPDPQTVVYKSLSELGEMVASESVEILHLNCSNRVLSHLPYLIALDHAEKAVVLALRGTIGITDLVTDAVVHPENIDDWLPDEVAEKLNGAPALAHAGMVAAASALFADMTERGILRELVEGDEAAIEDLTRGSRGGGAGGGGDGGGGGGGNSRGRGSPSHDGPPKQQNIHRNDTTSSQYHHYEEYGEEYTKKSDEYRSGAENEEATLAGSAVGDLIRKKVQEEGWQFVVVGHSLGGGAASLISLKLRHYYPQLKCLAFSCPGGLVSKRLSHAMTPFCTTIAVGKDAVPRASVATIARLMDELVTSLARCRQPKIRVLFLPWWRRHSQRFKDLFYDYKDIPEEAAEALLKYYESRRRLGQPIEMYPPGKIIFLRPIKSARGQREWDAVFVAPEDLMGEGILVSPNMRKDHSCDTAYEALQEAEEKAEAAEEVRDGRGGRQGAGLLGGLRRGAYRAVRAPWTVVESAAQTWGGQPVRPRRQGSLQQELINAV
jgi:hypothetical protein